MADVSDDVAHTTDPAQRWLRIQQVLDHSIDRRLAGEALADDEIIADHGDLMPELAAELRSLSIIEQARQRASGAEAVAWSPTPDGPAADTPSEELSGYETMAELRRADGVLTWHAIHDASDREVVIKIFEADVD